MNPSILTKKILKQILYVSRKLIPKKTAKKGPPVFKGRELIDYILKNHNENKLPRDEIAVFIADTFASPESATRFIWPIKGNYLFSDSNKTFLFLPQYLEFLGSDFRVLNVDEAQIRILNEQVEKSIKNKFVASHVKLPEKVSENGAIEKPNKETTKENNTVSGRLPSIEEWDTQPTYFFEDSFKSVEKLNEMEILVQEIQMTMLKIKAMAIDDENCKVDYNKVETSPEFQTTFKQLVSLLPFVDLKSIIANKLVNIAFFINLYNILTIHSLVTWKQEKGTMIITTMQRTSYFSRYKYCIGGYLFSLNDIEHGLLRGGDNFGNSGWRVFIAGLFTHSYTDHSRFRFSKRDGRRQLVLTDQEMGKPSNPRPSYSFRPKLRCQLVSPDRDILLG